MNSGLINAGVLNAMTFGVNWFLNPKLKFQFNYDITYRSQVAQTTAGWIDGVGGRGEDLVVPVRLVARGVAECRKVRAVGERQTVEGRLTLAAGERVHGAGVHRGARPELVPYRVRIIGVIAAAEKTSVVRPEVE